MKRENLDRVTSLCNMIRQYENTVECVLSKSCTVKISIYAEKIGGREVSIPTKHLEFLKRVIKDSYQGHINKLAAELETL